MSMLFGFIFGVLFSIAASGIYLELRARHEGNYGYKYEEYVPQMYRMRSGGMTIREIAKYTGIPKSTVHRYLQAVDRGLQSASDYEVSDDGSIKKKQND